MVVNKSADWGEEGEINISPDNIEVRDDCDGGSNDSDGDGPNFVGIKKNLENIEVSCVNGDDGVCDDDSSCVMERRDLIAPVYKIGNKVVVMSQRSE